MWDISLHNVGTQTGLIMHGSSINKSEKKKKNKYKQTIQVNKKKQIVLLPVQQVTINTGVLDGKIYRYKRCEKMKFPMFTMDFCRLLI